MRSYKILHYLAWCCIICLGCTTTQQTQQASLPPLPQAYNIKSDSGSAATINWKQYFKDTSLIRLIDTALANNLDVMMAYQRIEVARSNVKFAKGQYLPFVTGAGSVGQQNYGEYTQEGVGNFDTNFSKNISESQQMSPDLKDFYVGIHASWEVDVWGKLRNKRKAATAKYLASVEGRNWVVTNLIAEIAGTFYELLALDNELEIIQETIILQSNQLSIVETQKEAGRANELAVKQFEAQVLHSKGLEVEIAQKVIEAENKLNFLLGRYPQPIIRNNDHFTSEVPTQVLVGIPSELLNNRPDIKQAEHQLTATKANVKAAKAAFYPTFTISGSLGYHSFNPQYFISPQAMVYNIVGGLVTPLINQSAIKASFRTAKAEQLEAMYNYQKVVLNGYIEVYNQMVYINNLNRIYKYKNEEVEVLTTSIETASELFLTGRATYLEIIVTRSAALQSRIELINIKKRQFTSLVNIYRALGGGWQ
jgi:outer membrane protein, multidrug efflux system